jgi:hypothetical protein
MTVREIVRAYLDKHGYDGLYLWGTCGCLKDDLMPCGEPNPLCAPGYKLPGDEGYDWFVGSKETTDE